MNKVQLIGYLGADPEIREYRGASFVKLRLATQERQKNNAMTTTWHTVLFWGEEKARMISTQLIRGSHLLIEGSLDYKEYTNRNGETFLQTQINAFRFLNLDR